MWAISDIVYIHSSNNIYSVVTLLCMWLDAKDKYRER